VSAEQLPEARYQTLYIDNRPVRVFSLPLRASGERIGSVQVARSLDTMYRTLAQLRLLFIAEMVLFLGLSAFLGYGLAKRALRPVEQMTGTAKQIGERRDLSQRIPFSGPPDELGRLAGTINEMLDQLEHAYQQLEISYQTQKRFAADASHQLRTPLTIIRGNIDVLRHMGTADQEELAIALNDMASEAEQMSRLIDVLLTLARADAGQHLEKAPVRIIPLVRGVCKQMEVPAAQRKLQLESDLDAEDLVVLGDEDALRQVIVILIDNAIKYTAPDGMITIRLSNEKENVRIDVMDNGIGISDADSAHIFDRFYRAENGRRFKGLGLGLSLAKWIVEEHRGSISIDSRLGIGSCFTLRLPFIRDVSSITRL
jgi:signal transduction histidine kinase